MDTVQDIAAVEAPLEKVAKDLLHIRKEFNVLHSHVQSLVSQVMRLDREVRALALKKVVR